MRLAWAVLGVLLAACVDCPARMPEIADYGESNHQATVRAGDPARLSFFVFVKSECLDLSVSGPDGVIAATLDESGSTTIQTTRPGRYTGSVKLRGVIGGRAYSQSVTAVAEPPSLEACVTLPRGCSRVVDAQDRVACDETLLDRAGNVLTVLDGGAWFGSDDLLFAWHDGLLEKFDTADGGAAVTSSQDLVSRPRLWSVSRAGLALAVDDAGVVWDPTLSTARSFSVEPDAVALSLFDDGGVLLIRPGDDYACMAGGSCAPIMNDNPKVVAVDRHGVWVQRVFGFASSGVTKYESTRGFWSTGSGLADDGIQFLDPLPRRPISNTVWGLAADGVTGRWELEGTRAYGATDGVLWRSSETTTKLWCLP